MLPYLLLTYLFESLTSNAFSVEKQSLSNVIVRQIFFNSPDYMSIMEHKGS